MINLFLIYTCYGILLSLTAFFQRVYTQGLKLHGSDVMIALLMVMIEIAIFRYFLSLIRVSVFIGYRKKRCQWGKITRKKHNSKTIEYT
ncbi:hypothetical protein [Ureibacillus thermosphaericus]|uniref:hypothetical protein n=2 Tax=Ureibacillus TaxID=160795 RepID=UPI0018D4E384|nr:hypothetical protein [Ureibacillus thermosphaericus]